MSAQAWGSSNRVRASTAGRCHNFTIAAAKLCHCNERAHCNDNFFATANVHIVVTKSRSYQRPFCSHNFTFAEFCINGAEGDLQATNLPLVFFLFFSLSEFCNTCSQLAAANVTCGLKVSGQFMLWILSQQNRRGGGMGADLSV